MYLLYYPCVYLANGSISHETILSISIVATAVFSVLVTSIWSIIIYYCCFKKKQRDAERQQSNTYEAVDEQIRNFEEIKMHQSPAYAAVGEMLT